MKTAFDLALLSPSCYCLMHCKVLEVLRSLESWVSNEFQGIPRIHLGEVFCVHQASTQNDFHCFAGVVELCDSKAESHWRNGAHGRFGNGDAKVNLHLVDWICLRGLYWHQGAAARVQHRLFNAHFELPALCTEVSVHTAVPGASRHVNLLQKLLL